MAMECYGSGPEVAGCIGRMHIIWKERGMFDNKEQWLLNQKWQIVKKKC